MEEMPAGRSGLARKASALAALLSKRSSLSARPLAEGDLFGFGEVISNAGKITSAYDGLVRNVLTARYLDSEVEWLLENFYVIEGALSDVKQGVRRSELKKLPCVLNKKGVPVPRIYTLLSELLKTTDNTIDSEILTAFLRRYQRDVPLSIRELDLLPAILKLVLVYRMKNLIVRMSVQAEEYAYAETILTDIVKEARRSKDPSYVKLIASLSSRYKIISPRLGLYLIEELTDHSAKTRPIIKWLKLHFLKQGIRIKDLGEIVSEERDRVLADAAHIVEGLRWISQVRWNNLLLEIDPVEKILSRDPAREYFLMNDQGRGVYRRKIVRIADKTGIVDTEIAKSALRLAQNFLALKKDVSDPRAHVGYYLIDDGVPSFEKEAGYSPSLSERLYRFVVAHANLVYFGTVLLAVWFSYLLIFSGPFSVFARSSFVIFALTALSTILLLSEAVLGLFNMAITLFLPVKRVFSLDLHKGVGEERATFVVVPSMLRDPGSVKKLLTRLETTYIGNRDPHVFYALLLDFLDAPAEVMPHDDELVRSVQKGIAELNERYSSGGPVFFFFYRRRIWNPGEGVYMGWERKRGKLREFNRLVRGSEETSYVLSREFKMPHVRYIVTVDEDTEVPREAVIRLIGSISHSLSRPVFDESIGVVRRGYGVIQPRTSTRMGDAGRTLFSRLFSSAVGIDSYSGPNADVYQDLFGEGLFFGKGIYDIDVVERTMGDNIPENLILSHDLLEGLYARTGYASDIQFFDEFPTSFTEFESRNHRWIRGDWQIIQWLGKNGGRFTVAGRWKIFDNLRRSLLSAAAVVLLVISFSFGMSLEIAVMTLIVAAFGLSAFVGAFIGLFFGLRAGLGRVAFALFFKGMGTMFARVSAQMIFLLYDAYVSLHAIILVFVRMTITHRRLLQWRTAYDVARKRKDTVGAYAFAMSPAVILSFVFAFAYIALPFRNGEKVSIVAGVMIGVWAASFFVAYVFGTRRDLHPKLTQQERMFLRTIAYRSSRYFTDLSVEKNNHLIPDHYQVDIQYSGFAPGTITSPTNMGMMLVSFFSAYRLGFLGLSEFIERISASLRTLSSLERYRGHLYNWYDIHKCIPVGSKYVSAADSANFIIGCVTVRRGLLDLLDGPVLDIVKRREGLVDSVIAIIDDANAALAGCEHKSLRHSIKHIIEKATKARVDIERRSVGSYSMFLDLLVELEKHNISIRESVEKLQLQTDHVKIAPIYSSTEYFRGLVEQCRSDLDLFLSIHLSIETMLDGYGHWCKDPELAPLWKTVSDMAHGPITIRTIAKGHFADALSRVDANVLIERSCLRLEEKRLAKHLFTSIISSATIAEENAIRLMAETERLADICETFITESDFSFLFNNERGLFHIGYNAAHDEIDNAYYDFLASESNLISFVATLKGQNRMEQWFGLGRRTIKLPKGGSALASWGGSLFEYLTPLIFMRAPEGSILHEAGRRAARSQMRYAAFKRTPWGMGESACAKKNVVGDYHYQIFGDPALGFKRGLEDQIVVAPYTTAMAMSYGISRAIGNFKKLINDRAFGSYGFYDAVEYTNGKRLFRRRKGTVAEIYYAHHLGFTMASLLNVLEEGEIQKLFHSDPRVSVTDFLLEEAYPVSIPLVRSSRSVDVPKVHPRGIFDEKHQKEFVPAIPPSPRYAFLSNGSFSTVVDSSGGGFSAYKGRLITRRTSDPTTTPVGSFIYIKNARTGDVWSVPHLPVAVRKGSARTILSEDSVEFSRHYGPIESTMRISVHSQEPMEMRTVTLSNTGISEEVVDLVSYGEIVLATPSQDAHHPLFHKMFVRTNEDRKNGMIFFEKRTAMHEKGTLFGIHVAIDHDNTAPAVVHSTNREDFAGVGGNLASPISLKTTTLKKMDTPYTLDPIFSLAKRVTIPAGGSATVTFLTAVSEDRDAVKEIVKKYSKRLRRRKMYLSERPADDPFALLGITPYYARIFRRLLSGIIAGEYITCTPFKKRTKEPAVRILWRNGISGDLPIFAVRISGIGEMPLLRSALMFWRYALFKGVDMDVVVMNEHPTSYNRSFEDDIDTLIRHISSEKDPEQKGGVFHLKVSLMEKEDPGVIEGLSHAIVRGGDGSLEKQVRAMFVHKPDLPKKFIPVRPVRQAGKGLPRPKGLFADNGIGGFDPVTGEYVMYVNKNNRAPVPWTNIIATEKFGTIVSNSGASYTWSGDSYDNRLTAWYNDPLFEKSGEAFYLRDEESGELWSPTPFPVPSPRSYIVKHGAGYSTFKSAHQLIHAKLTMFVPKEKTLKVCHFSVENRSERTRRLSLSAYTEPVLGALREHSQSRVSVMRDEITSSLIVRNDFRNHFCDRFMFLDAGDGCSYTADRREFIGPCGDLKNPAVFRRKAFSDSLLSGDPCAALMKKFVIEPGEAVEFTVLLGEAKDEEEMRALIAEFRNVSNVKTSFDETRKYWKDISEKFVFETPNKDMDMIANHWLTYQNLSSRVFARTGYYQPSGAFGFRDQLQDVVACAWTEPQILHDHIIEAAGRQFLEGDALNWWHAHNNFGLRSMVSDHHLWLVWATLRYVSVTGDLSILDEQAPFLSSPVPNFVDRQWTGIPEDSGERATLYEHCIRALDKSAVFGVHGLPLIGAGDWNDGLNHVGDEGKGESVWLAWFILQLLDEFIPYSERRNDERRVERFSEIRGKIKIAVEKHAWDGAWYRRGFLDNGAPLGSSANREYRIDSVAQSFAVLCGNADIERAKIAMDSVAERLFVGDQLKLIDPPVDAMAVDIGYLSAYPPGVRENGAQYDHAALWCAQAFARLGDEEMLEKALGCVDPIERSRTKEKTLQYRTEPYVIASDIYAEPSYSGRGGWTWYTGSAGVLYRTLVEYVFGLQVKGGLCSVNPTLPASWPNASLTYRYKNTAYRIVISRDEGRERGVRIVTLDGTRIENDMFALLDDGKDHRVEVVIGASK